MKLEVRIVKELWARFAEVRIVRDLVASGLGKRDLPQRPRGHREKRKKEIGGWRRAKRRSGRADGWKVEIRGKEPFWEELVYTPGVFVRAANTGVAGYGEWKSA
jgi:hypothetical protein